jgi:hypothetical protein
MVQKQLRSKYHIQENIADNPVTKIFGLVKKHHNRYKEKLSSNKINFSAVAFLFIGIIQELTDPRLVSLIYYLALPFYLFYLVICKM